MSRGFRIEIRFCDDCVRSIRRHPELGLAPIFTCPTCCIQAPTLEDAFRHLFPIPDLPTPRIAAAACKAEETIARALVDFFQVRDERDEPKRPSN